MSKETAGPGKVSDPFIEYTDALSEGAPLPQAIDPQRVDESKPLLETVRFLHGVLQEASVPEELARRLEDRLSREWERIKEGRTLIPRSLSQAFEQLISRFSHFLNIMNRARPESNMGLVIHDNNPTSCRRMSDLMIRFRKKGTLWTNIDNIIETPLYVNSSLTSMVQVADLCSYALRRYLENDEDELFLNVFKRADRKDGRVVGVRHFPTSGCRCNICASR